MLPRPVQTRVQLQQPCRAVYKVTVSRHPTCTCPDAAKGNVCKHQLFVMLRVLHLDSRDPVIWQRGLLSAEVQHIWEVSEQRSSAGALHTGVTASAALQAAYAASQAAAASPGAGGPPDRPVSGDCPICYDEMQPGGKTSAVSSQPCSHAAAVQYIVSVLCSAHVLHVRGPPAVRHPVLQLQAASNELLRGAMYLTLGLLQPAGKTTLLAASAAGVRSLGADCESP